MNSENNKLDQTEPGAGGRPAQTAAQVFLISGILYCVWMVLDIVMVVLALGPVGLVFGLTALPNRGILIVMCFAAARTVGKGRYLSAAIALAGYALLTNIVLAILTLTAFEGITHIAVFAISVALSVSLCLLSLIAMHTSIAAYRAARAKDEVDSSPKS